MTDFEQLLTRLSEHRWPSFLSAARPQLRTARHVTPWTWTSSISGNIDVLGEIVGGGTYEDLLPGAVELELFGTRCHCLSLRQLIRAKRAAGRPRDFDAIAEMEAIEEESRG